MRLKIEEQNGKTKIDYPTIYIQSNHRFCHYGGGGCCFFLNHRRHRGLVKCIRFVINDENKVAKCLQNNLEKENDQLCVQSKQKYFSTLATTTTTQTTN